MSGRLSIRDAARRLSDKRTLKMGWTSGLAILVALEGHRLRPLYVLLAGTGLRIGEASGLRWAEDINLGGSDDGVDLAAAQRRYAGGGAAEASTGGLPGLAPLRRDPPDKRAGSHAAAPSRHHLSATDAYLTVTYQLQRIAGEKVLTDPKTDTAA